jgi:cellulose synthase/poly-beta-1,6-N-acetylglucosamine synthase-like glycosyltransferase
VQVFILIAMALELFLLLALVRLGRGYVRKSLLHLHTAHPKPSEPEEQFPRVALIIPLTGRTPEMQGCLETLLHQQYPDYEIIMVTRDRQDPATALVREILPAAPKARHVLSGPASGCGQKNHNLLAGVAAVGPSVPVLVFCDSAHRASPDFLRDLVRPIMTGEAHLTTCFHRVIPGDYRLATLGMVGTVLGIQLLQGIKPLAQPWGGAMAMPRTVFAAHGVARLWAQTVVDDVSLVPVLTRAGIKVHTVPGATLATLLAGQTWAGWVSWLTRQLLFVKFCLPGTWLLATPAALLGGGPILLAGCSILGSLGGVAPWHLGLAGLGFLIGLTAVGVWVRALVPQAIPLARWIAAFYALLLVTSWCYLKTWFTNSISWRGISYRVTWGGRVKG